jgi:hypothetical protein
MAIRTGKVKVTAPTVAPAKADTRPKGNVEAYNKALEEKKFADTAKLVAKRILDKHKSKLKASSITGYYVQSNVVYFYVDASFKALANKRGTATLNRSHWVQGLGDGINGIFNSDITQVTGTDWAQIKLSQDRPNLALKNIGNGMKTPGTIWSYDGSKIESYTTLDWKEELVKAGDTTHTPGQLPQDVPVKQLSGEDEVEFVFELYEYTLTIASWQKEKETALNNALKKLNDDEKKLGLPPTVLPPDQRGRNNNTGNTGAVTPPIDSNKGTLGVGDDTKPVIYNLPGVKEMYFRDEDFAAMFVTEGNRPRTIITDANDLWNGVKGSKGMIQSYIVPARLSKEATTWFKPQDATGGNIKNINTRRFGFQFIYNPSTVSMHYAGAPQVDIGLQMSGTDKVPLIGSGVTSSTVTFSLLLNRMNDFKYLDQLLWDNNLRKAPPKLAASYSSTASALTFEDIYSHKGNHELNRIEEDNIDSVWQELEKIKNLGTMYDVEYLLRTLLGYQLPSATRGGLVTSDIGYLGAYPVELHLGKNLRYLVTIDSFELSHTIFTKDMVPVFTNLQITCNRLPDFAKRFNEIDIKAPTGETE